MVRGGGVVVRLRHGRLAAELSDRSFTGVLALLMVSVLTLLGDIDAQSDMFDAAKLAVLPIAALLLVYGGVQAVREVAAQEAAWGECRLLKSPRRRKRARRASAYKAYKAIRALRWISRWTKTRRIGPTARFKKYTACAYTANKSTDL